MKKELSLALVGILVLSIYVPVAAPPADGEMVGLIFETDDAAALTSAIEAAGGYVSVEFNLVPMIAGKVPLLNVEDVLGNPHCLFAWKDRVQNLPRTPEVSEGDNFTAAEILNVEDFNAESATPADIGAILPENYYNYMVTGAEDVWLDPDVWFGDGTLVAVIDTGTYPYHPCFMWPDGTSTVIGGISFAPGEPEDSWDDPDNHYHGTVCGGLVAAHCYIDLPKDYYLAQSFMMYAPAESYDDYGSFIRVYLYGMAPLAEIYAIKVFPKDGSGVPSSVIMQGIEHAIEMRKLYDATGGAEGYPIDVISMSLGGGTGYDGKDPEDLLVDEATKTGIVVSVAAGNDGPASNTVSSPGTAKTSISVGAAADGPHTRIGWDINYGMAGIGEYFFPYDDVQIIYFSGHGPTSDGRLAPDVLACGVYAMSAFPPYYIGTMSGTSSACPIVSGGCALLVAWQKANGGTNPYKVRNAVLEGAVPLTLPYPATAQGHGYLNIPSSIALLEAGIDDGLHLHTGYQLEGVDLKGGSQTWYTGELRPSLGYEIVIQVDEDTERIDICLSDVYIEGPGNPLMGDTIEFYVQGAVRTALYPYYDSVNLISDQCFTIDDPHDGLMKIRIEGDWTNWNNVACNVTVTETEGKDNNGGHKETIGFDELHVFYIEVPEDLGAVMFELWWTHNWSKFPTYDLDMYVIDPSGNWYYDGAVFWSPERQWIYTPEPGTYIVLVYGYEIYHGRDPYQLRIFYIV